jgi:hypothetical protein
MVNVSGQHLLPLSGSAICIRHLRAQFGMFINASEDSIGNLNTDPRFASRCAKPYLPPVHHLSRRLLPGLGPQRTRPLAGRTLPRQEYDLRKDMSAHYPLPGDMRRRVARNIDNVCSFPFPDNEMNTAESRRKWGNGDKMTTAALTH